MACFRVKREGTYFFTECSEGFFGPNCTLPCGFCLNGLCNHANGVCQQGCQSGYGGVKCVNGKSRPVPNVVMYCARVYRISGIFRVALNFAEFTTSLKSPKYRHSEK